MRFVAGRGAVAERLQRSGAVAEMLAAAWRIAIGKKLLPGRAIGKLLPARVPWQSCWSGVPWRRGWRHCGREPSGRAAGRGTLAELLAGGAMEDRGKRARQLAPARKAICRKGCTIGKTLQAGALLRRAIGKQARKEPTRQAGKEHPVLQANKKESGKNHSLLSPLL